MVPGQLLPHLNFADTGSAWSHIVYHHSILDDSTPSPGLRNPMEPWSQAARKWRENEEMKRKWRENEEMERKWRENEEMERE